MNCLPNTWRKPKAIGGAILEDSFSFVHRFWLIKPTAWELGSLIDNLRQGQAA